MLYILSQADNSLAGLSFDSGNARESAYEIWEHYFQYYVSHPEQIYFHQAYHHSSYFATNLHEEYINSFPHFQAIVLQCQIEEFIPPKIFWTYTIESTLTFAHRVSEGLLPNDAPSIRLYFKLLSDGISGVIKSQM